MDDDETRKFLFTFYNEKNNLQIRNIYSLIASFLGILLSGALSDNKYLQIQPWQLLIVFVPPFFYFLLRSAYWTKLTWLITKVKKIELDFSKYEIFEDNIIAQYYMATYKQAKNMTLFRIKFDYTNNFYFKWFFLIIAPPILYLIFLYAERILKLIF